MENRWHRIIIIILLRDMINISRWYLVSSRQGYLLLLSIPPKMSRRIQRQSSIPKIPKSVHPNPRIKEMKRKKSKRKENTPKKPKKTPNTTENTTHIKHTHNEHDTHNTQNTHKTHTQNTQYIIHTPHTSHITG